LPDQLSLIVPYILAATAAGLTGGIVASVWNPRVRARSAIQHFAAGAVLAAVAANVVPEVTHVGNRLGVLAGFALGGLVMIALKWLVVRVEREQKRAGKLPVGLAAAAAVDTFLDGVIISAGFSTDQQLGALLVAALALELFFLTLSVGAEFRKGKLTLWQGLAVTSGIAALLPAGAFGAGFFLAGASAATLAVVLAFGAAALIYLIAEELLVESIQAEASLFSTAMLFSGFLVLLALKLFSQGSS
jgi:ZIP family zinc transporter